MKINIGLPVKNPTNQYIVYFKCSANDGEINEIFKINCGNYLETVEQCVNFFNWYKTLSYRQQDELTKILDENQQEFWHYIAEQIPSESHGIRLTIDSYYVRYFSYAGHEYYVEVEDVE